MLRRTLGALLCLSTLVPLTQGCDGYTPPSTGCAAPLAVTVTAGTEPSFSWAGDCRLARVMVESAASGAEVWGAISPLGTNALSPPVAYGGTPPGAIATANMVPQLVSGTTYRVILAAIRRRGCAPGRRERDLRALTAARIADAGRTSRCPAGCSMPC